MYRLGVTESIVPLLAPIRAETEPEIHAHRECRIKAAALVAEIAADENFLEGVLKHKDIIKMLLYILEWELYTTKNNKRAHPLEGAAAAAKALRYIACAIPKDVAKVDICKALKFAL